MTHAEAMAAALKARGVDTVFGLPGGEILAFVDACRRQGMRFLLTGHEASAGWMAQVVGQLTGTAGVCATTLGPGASNLMTAVANAWLDRAPLLAVTADIPRGAAATMTHQRLPLHRLFSPITKASLSVGKVETTELVNQCLDLAVGSRPGPVHLSLESDIAIQECGGAGREADFAAGEAPASIQPMIDAVHAASRPIVLVGLGATPDTAPAIRRLIGKLQCPFVVTPKVKGIVSEDDARFAGVASGMALDGEVVETLREADLIVAVGFDPVECDKTWFASLNVAAIDTVSMAEGDYRPLEALGEIAELVDALTAGITAPKPWPGELLEARRRAVQPIFLEVESPVEAVSPMRLIEELRAIFPRDGIAACDVGSHKLAMGQFWKSFEPGTFLMSNGLSGMGFGLPAAVAAQLVHPDKAVLAVVGDGGMLMMIHDLALIRELHLPILMVVFRDSSLSLIRLSGERRGYPSCGVDFTPPDFRVVAKGFGIDAGRAKSLHEARAMAEKALEVRRPFLLEVAVDWREYRDVMR